MLPAMLAAVSWAGTASAENIGVSIARFDNAFQAIVRNGVQDALEMEDAASDPSKDDTADH